jgi:uncharacterized protein YkwD
MSNLARRLGPIVLAGLLIATLAPLANAADDLTVEQAEAKVASLLNAQRTDVGRVVLRIDSRLSAIARGRSEDMAAKGYFSHQQPDGDWAWDLMTAAGIKWYGAGEIIAWNTWGSLADSAISASKQWHDSATHYAMLTSANYNYFGVGLAVDGSGKKLWTVVFMKGPDRTGAKARFRTSSNIAAETIATASTSTAHKDVTIKWTGADVRLQVLTAGLKYFQVQVRVEGRYDWRDTKSSTTATSMVRSLVKGRVYQFRIRAKDKAGNYGRWSETLWIRP